jgi:hypothetical protein
MMQGRIATIHCLGFAGIWVDLDKFGPGLEKASIVMRGLKGLRRP